MMGGRRRGGDSSCTEGVVRDEQQEQPVDDEIFHRMMNHFIGR